MLRIPHYALVLKSCDFVAGPVKMHLWYYTCTKKLRFRAGAARVCTVYGTCTESHDFRARAAKTLQADAEETARYQTILGYKVTRVVHGVSLPALVSFACLIVPEGELCSICKPNEAYKK